MVEFFTMEAVLAIGMLALMEIVLGIDNIVFIAILSDRLPKHQQSLGRRLGLAIALVSRLILLFTISWVMGLTKPWLELSVFNHHIELTGQSFVLLAGGLFLIYKATTEIWAKTELQEHEQHAEGEKASLASVIFQIAIIDVVFSLDSIITAVGMVDHIAWMVIAIVIAIFIMIIFADKVSGFVNNNPSVKMLALAFLLLIGVLLTAEAFEYHIPRGYVYFAMAFSIGIELLQMRRDSNRRKQFEKGIAPCPVCGKISSTEVEQRKDMEDLTKEIGKTEE